MIKRISLFSVIILSVIFMITSCNNDDSLEPLPEEPSNFKESTSAFFKEYRPSAIPISEEELASRMPSGCGPEIHSNCMSMLETAIVQSDAPFYCPVKVDVTVTICIDAAGNHLVSFVPHAHEVINPNPNNPLPTDQWCSGWADAIEACLAAGDLACAEELVNTIKADAFDQFELDFIADYTSDNAGLFLCSDANAVALQTEYFDATCTKVCELNDPPVWQIISCGSGCCIRTNSYCATDGGGVSRGPSSYRQEQGLCGDPQGELRCKPVIECYSTTCPSDD